MSYSTIYPFPLFSQLEAPATSDLFPAKGPDLKKICSQFESIFITHLLRQMRKGLPKSDFLGGGIVADILRDQWDQILAEKIAQGGGFGLAKILYEKVSQQEAKGKYEVDHLPANKVPGLSLSAKRRDVAKSNRGDLIAHGKGEIVSSPPRLSGSWQ